MAETAPSSVQRAVIAPDRDARSQGDGGDEGKIDESCDQAWPAGGVLKRRLVLAQVAGGGVRLGR